MRARTGHSAFTLVELLVVIAILGIIAAMVGPSVSQFGKGDAIAAATRQMLDDVARARQLAISQRTTVYMVFAPPRFWTYDAYFRNVGLIAEDRIAATNIAGKQFTGYSLVTMRRVGDQPGQNVPRYISSWKTLPESTFIATQVFLLRRTDPPMIVRTNPLVAGGFEVYGFQVATNIPFPRAETPFFSAADRYPPLPYVAFDYLGRLTSGRDEYIPIGHGIVARAIDPVTKLPLLSDDPTTPSVIESPSGNVTNSYNIIHIDWLTGRARLEKREIQ